MQTEFKTKAFIAPWQGEGAQPILSDDAAYYTQHGYKFVGYATVTIQPATTKDEIKELKEVLQKTLAENKMRERAVINKIKNLEALTYESKE